MTAPSLLWFRQDLRLADHPALVAAAAAGPVIPVYVLDDEGPGDWAIGGAQRWWLHGSLASLAKDLEALGSRLILRRGRSEAVLANLLEESGAERVHATKHGEPWWRAADAALGERIELHDGNHLAPLGSICTGGGKHYRIYGSFWKALQGSLPPEKPVPAPKKLTAPARWPKGDKLADWHLLPTKPDWASDFHGTPGEATAQNTVRAFAAKVGDYEAHRNLPAEEGTSGLSPHLHHGEVSPRAVWHAMAGHKDAEKFLRELAWRDFTDNLTLDLPDYADRNGRPAFDKMKWRKAPKELRAWQQGRTGYPIVDAGMRQLWQSGWMHNRVRMITASFLIKHLLIDWREGERWFWDTLVDADYGNNSVNWQWIAGSGVDANMWSRIMTPIGQSEKFAAADYIRRWVPELADLSDAHIHDPETNGVRPDNYPAPIIGHREARERALAAGRAIR
ncbi:cryptochrome/photolyase family protein [Sphingomonas guangdongensis]|nr:deoxyribodipyrimidine photo-lyase [Sphingomonas guangdongensis]